MSSPSAPSSRAPWIVAAVALAVFLAAIIVYFVVLVPDRSDQPAAGALTSTEQRAVSAASAEAVNLLSYRKAHFAADFARALAGTTGALHQNVTSEKSQIQKTLQTADLFGRVTNAALVGPTTSGNGYVVLVTVNGYNTKSPNAPRQQNLEMTVLNKNGRFLASNITEIGLS